MKLTNPNFPHRARLIVSAIRSEQMRDEHFRPTGERSGPLPFVTISRQAIGSRSAYVQNQVRTIAALTSPAPRMAERKTSERANGTWTRSASALPAAPRARAHRSGLPSTTIWPIPRAPIR